MDHLTDWLCIPKATLLAWLLNYTALVVSCFQVSNSLFIIILKSDLKPDGLVDWSGEQKIIKKNK